MVWSIRIALALQGNSVVLEVRERAVNPVAHVHLDSRHRRQHLKLSSRLRVEENSSLLQTLSVQTEAVV